MQKTSPSLLTTKIENYYLSATTTINTFLPKSFVRLATEMSVADPRLGEWVSESVLSGDNYVCCFQPDDKSKPNLKCMFWSMFWRKLGFRTEEGCCRCKAGSNSKNLWIYMCLKHIQEGYSRLPVYWRKELNNRKTDICCSLERWQCLRQPFSLSCPKHSFKRILVKLFRILVVQIVKSNHPCRLPTVIEEFKIGK